MTEPIPTAATTADPVASTTPELLAPAGDMTVLQAALAAGADAVYLGLTMLNARRRARNFSPEEFREAVQLAHAQGARVYLTLNVDVAERELHQAARMLELARQAGADAVLVRDPALLALRPEFPELEFHFSTQSCMANSVDVEAASDLGASRVVLARELTLAEIAAASAVPGIHTEVFIQGALCFCVSGRCLLSSWVGGRSGNRGGCTSPCRVPWTADDEPVGTPFSMRDLSTVQRLDELRDAGVTALKIEGRLKTADWVRQAVGAYRRVLDGEPQDAVLPQVVGLGGYTGRLMTDDYLDGERDQLTGLAKRESRRPPEAGPAGDEGLCDAGDAEDSDAEAEFPLEAEAALATADQTPAESARGAKHDFSYDLEILVSGKSIACRCQCRDIVENWTMPKTVIHRRHRAVSLDQVLRYLSDHPQAGFQLGQGATDDPEFLLVPRARNALLDRICSVVQRARKVRDKELDIELPETVEALLARGEPHPANRRHLGGEVDRARLDVSAVESFLEAARPDAVIVEGLTADRVRSVQRACRRLPLIVALPPVFFEQDLPAIEELLEQCARARAVVEVNSWAGWRLAKRAGVRIEGGPGLAVLNSLAAHTLTHRGLECVTLSPEADRKQLEDLTVGCAASTSLVVFGRPPLLTSRVEMSQDLVGRVLEDRRGVQLTARQEHGLWVFRPQQPFDLRNLRNERIVVRHLVVDLVGSPDPIGEWFEQRPRKGPQFRFNYDRQLA